MKKLLFIVFAALLFTDARADTITTNLGNSATLSGSSSGVLTQKAAAAASGTITWPAGTIDFSATGGTSQVLKQVTSGSTFTVGQLASSDLSNSANIALYNAAGTWTAAQTYNGVAVNWLDSGAVARGVLALTGSNHFYVGDYNNAITGGNTNLFANNQIIGTVNGTNRWVVSSTGVTVTGTVGLNGSSTGTLQLKAPAAAGSNTLTFPAGTTDFSATGGTSQVVKQTSSGGALTVAQLAYSDLSGTVPLTSLATQATNTVVGNATSGTAAPTALAVGTCSTSASAIIWTTNTGFGCNTSVNAATLGGATFASPGAIGGTTPSNSTFTTTTSTQSTNATFTAETLSNSNSGSSAGVQLQLTTAFGPAQGEMVLTAGAFQFEQAHQLLFIGEGSGGVGFWGAGGAGIGDVTFAAGNQTSVAMRLTTGEHIQFHQATGPTVGSGAGDCGTSPAIVGTDNAGRVTVGSIANGGFCTVTFNNSWTNAPICIVNDETTNITARATNIAVGSFRITGVIVAGDKLDFYCVGYE